MKVLVIEGCRLNGNTDILCEQFIKGCQEKGNSVEKINLFNKDIKGCLDCRTCRKNGGTCVWKDDGSAILNKMVEADCIVLASPVYWYSITAQLKLVIDRSFSIEDKIKNKKMIFITSAAAPYQEPYAKFLDNATNTYLGYIECFHGEVENAGIIAGWGMGSIYQDVKESPAYEQAYNLGKEL